MAAMMILMVVLLAVGGPRGHMGPHGANGLPSQTSQSHEHGAAKPEPENSQSYEHGGAKPEPEKP